MSHIYSTGGLRLARAPIIQIAATTGPLAPIRGARVLAIFDMENIAISASRLGYTFNVRAAARLLKAATRTCHMHAFFSRRPGDNTDADLLRSCGYIPHPRDIEKFVSHAGVKSEANSDNFVAYYTGLLCSRASVDVVLLASGDGSLVCDLACAISDLRTRRTVVTLSLPGSTSHRLNAATNPRITANLEIGLDYLTVLPTTADILRRII